MDLGTTQVSCVVSASLLCDLCRAQTVGSPAGWGGARARGFWSLGGRRPSRVDEVWGCLGVWLYIYIIYIYIYICICIYRHHGIYESTPTRRQCVHHDVPAWHIMRYIHGRMCTWVVCRPWCIDMYLMYRQYAGISQRVPSMVVTSPPPPPHTTATTLSILYIIYCIYNACTTTVRMSHHPKSTAHAPPNAPPPRAPPRL
jgi:hypothetical protein